MKKFQIKRRSLLRGAAGAALGLPLLNVMGDEPVQADGGAGTPCRFVMAYAAGTSLGHSADSFKPDREGLGYDLPASISPLGAAPGGDSPIPADWYQNVQEHVSVISGMSMPYASPEQTPDGPGTRTVTLHEGVTGPLLTGRSSWTNGYYESRDTQGRLVQNPSATGTRGPSATAAVGARIGSDRVFPVLDYAIESSRSVTYLEGGTPNRPEVAESNPRQAYLSLVGAAPMPEGPDPAALARENAIFERRMSVLDLVQDDARRLESRLGGEDARRVQKHFSEVRALEMQIETLRNFEPSDYCGAFTDPGAPPSETYPGYRGQHERGLIFNQLIAKALACDLTRSVGMMISARQSRTNLFPIIGFDGDLHFLTHSGTEQSRSLGDHNTRLNAQMEASVRWHVTQFANLVKVLSETPDGPDSTLIDNTALVFVTEGGWGFDPRTGNTESAHSTENYCALVAGHAGGLQPGRHVAAMGAHPTLAVTSAMRAAGAGSNLNEIEGAIEPLFG